MLTTTGPLIRTLPFLKSPVSLDRIRDLDAALDRFDFPREKGDFTFSDTSIYWRGADAEHDPGGEALHVAAPAAA